MKSSRYNFIFEDYKLLFNAVTCGFAKIDPENFVKISTALSSPTEKVLNNLEPEILSKLIKGNFLIADEIDELSFMEAAFQLGRFGNKNLGLTIAPTLECNLKCTYCYEQKKRGVMSDKTINKVISFVESYDNIKSLSINWYGGEPLLYPKILFELSDKLKTICIKNGITFGAGLVTNGYLLNPSIAKILKEMCSIKDIQITLDGPPLIHNLRRPLKNGGQTFDRILDNLIFATEFFHVILRVNLDKQIYKDFSKLLNILSKLGLQERLSIGLGMVSAGTSICKDYTEYCFETREFAQFEIRAVQMLESYGFRAPLFPRRNNLLCLAVSPNSFVIDPEGNLYKCWETVGDEAEITGTLEHPKELTPSLIKWLIYNPFKFNKCRNCKFLPLCMGGCPYHQINKVPWRKPKNPCTTWRYNLKEALIWQAGYLHREKSIQPLTQGKHSQSSEAGL